MSAFKLCKEETPKIEEKGFSKQVIVWYQGIPNDKVEGYGIAYFHPKPPHNGIEWVDFANYGRVPYKWAYIPD